MKQLSSLTSLWPQMEDSLVFLSQDLNAFVVFCTRTNRKLVGQELVFSACLVCTARGAVLKIQIEGNMDRGGKITSCNLFCHEIRIKRLLVLAKTTYVTSLSHFTLFIVIYLFLPFIVRAHSARHAVWVWSSVKVIEVVCVF